MQQSPLTLRQRLIDAVDERYHVKDMGTIIEVLGTLERLSVTKELLETTRLGKTVNEFRKRINDEKLAKRAKALVKKWRDAVLVTEKPPTLLQAVRSLNGNSSDGVHTPPIPNHGSLRAGFNSNSSSPKLTPSSKVSPNAIYNSNSLSPRILSNLPTNNNNLNRNGQRPISSAVSSPALSTSSPSLRMSSPSLYNNNKTKSPFEPTTSPHNKTLTNSYAPNVEVVARTNAANKRLRIEDANGPTSNYAPPLKKAKRIPNGIIEGTLDDPLIVLDDLSKDSFASRVSDNSDGYSSKPVSNISSGALLSAAPSPLSVTQDSNHSPPLLIGGEIGAELSSGALISQDDTKTSFSTISTVENDIINSAVNLGANEPPLTVATVEPEVRLPAKRGRKKKESTFVDAATLLHQQIAAAQQEGRNRTIQRLSMEKFEDEPSHSHVSESNTEPPKVLPQTLSTADPVLKNEFVEKYLQSQNELRTKMERQYQDAVKRKEIVIEPLPPPVTEGETETKKKKKKRKNKEENLIVLPSESEILSRLPPIDPQILEELKNFKFEATSETEEQAKSKSENETEISTSLTAINGTKPESSNEDVIGTKIDWGDSDDEDNFMEVTPGEEIKHPQQTDTTITDSTDPSTTLFSSTYPTPMDVDISLEEKLPLQPKEVDDSDVDRLHLEKVENLNGNTDKDNAFKEWHEVLTVKPCNGELLLHILPYTIIDF